MNTERYKKALLIREVENTFLKLFSEGKLNGTVHTCVGQELSALAFAGQLKKTDYVVSNHRGHGHYIAFTDEYENLVAELLGKKSGICGGIGSSQHLYRKNFLTNGIQGGIMPVAAGMALAEKLKGSGNIVAVFIGDGTLGEGVVYETMNIASLWELPLLIVCEDNKYAQTTPQTLNLAGGILKRAEAFGIKTNKSAIWQTSELYSQALESINTVRETGLPLFHHVELYRLNAHSKGDDLRNSAEKTHFYAIDPMNVFENNGHDVMAIKKEIQDNISALLEKLDEEDSLTDSNYIESEVFEIAGYKWEPQVKNLENVRVYERINQFLHDKLAKDDKLLILGEDILDPYGGAFKVTKGLSAKFPDKVFTTPISEAAITGIGNGLALNGFRPFVEIMFGDFITLAFDQIVNHASKFFHMYNFQVKTPLVIRTPMGGWRGYGPTHSQSLERFLIGIDNIKVVAINSFIDPYKVYEYIYAQHDPVIALEYKTAYGLKLKNANIKGYSVENSFSDIPITRIKPSSNRPDLTIVTYGYMANYIVDNLFEIINGADLIPEIIILSEINPVDIRLIKDSVTETEKLVVIEEGNETGGVGAQILLQLHHEDIDTFKSRVIGALPVPLPSVKTLENAVLPNTERIIKTIKEMKYETVRENNYPS